MSNIQRIGLRHDITANWESGNPTLVVDETVIEDDTGRILRGDGGAYNTSHDIVGTLGAPDMVMGKYVGEIFMKAGPYKAPSASFPAVCLTAIDDYATISSINYPLLVPELRTFPVVFLDQLSGETDEFAGNASGSVITLTSTTANNALLAVLAEHVAAFSDDYDSLGALQWDGTDYAITDVDAVTREITVTGTPTAGAGNATFYPHRIAGSTTTARIQSWRGRSPIGANGAEGETISGLMRRDQMQGHVHGIQRRGAADPYSTDSDEIRIDRGSPLGAATPTNVVGTTGTDSSESYFRAGDPREDLNGNGPPRAGTTNHNPDSAVNIYLNGGIYNA